MTKFTTQGITVSVEPTYQPLKSSPYDRQFLFIYKVRIENNTSISIRLLEKHLNAWHDSGMKVTAQQAWDENRTPVIEPCGFLEYAANCRMHTEFSSLNGWYDAEELLTNTKFKVIIPKFYLVFPQKMN